MGLHSLAKADGTIAGSVTPCDIVAARSAVQSNNLGLCYTFGISVFDLDNAIDKAQGKGAKPWEISALQVIRKNFNDLDVNYSGCLSVDDKALFRRALQKGLKPPVKKAAVVGGFTGKA